MSKKLLAILLAVCMLVCLLPTTALAVEAQPVAKIGETEYETFDAAYTAAKTGDTIVLLKTVVIDGGTIVNYSTKNITVKANFGATAFRVQGDPIMVKFGGMTIESDDYCIIVGASDGTSGA